MREAFRVRDALQQFLDSAGWEILNEWIQQEIDERRREYEEGAPLRLDDTYITGFRRAQLGMLRTIQDMPAKLLATQQDAIDQVNAATGAYNGGED